MKTNKQELEEQIYKEYKTMLLSTQEVSEIINVSKTTLGRWKKKGIHLVYKQNKLAKNAPIFYPIGTIAEYILNNNCKII